MWEDGSKMEKTWWRSSSTNCHLICIFVTIMRLITTTTSVMHCHQFKIHGRQIGGSVGYLISCWTYQRLMHFWSYTTFYTVGYIRRECQRYRSFVRSWRGNLLTIDTLCNGRGGVEFLPDSIHWLVDTPRNAERYHNRMWICITKTAYQDYCCRFKCGKR